MTPGQKTAVAELKRLAASSDGAFELVDDPAMVGSSLLCVTVSLRIGMVLTDEGGLPLRDREDFLLVVPEDFPFERPWLRVTHGRFAGFSHVVWGKTICLYQSDLEWNPSDGLYGFFDRLRWWLAKAAVNDMDPLEGPLEPPHHDTDSSYAPFVVRVNAPCAAGEAWTGLAILETHSNRTEIVGWNDLSDGWPHGSKTAFAVMLPGLIPMEFPSNGAELFRELENAGMGDNGFLANLGVAAVLADDGDPLYLVVGLPMRRAADGSVKIHIAVWAASAEVAQTLRLAIPKEADSVELAKIRKELAEKITNIFEKSKIKWCRVLEDRREIVVKRDGGTPLAWIADRRILILGCGALGSWAAELLVRSGPKSVHLVDDGIVKPGLLVRQNFTLEDIGSNKAEALAGRLRQIDYRVEIIAHAEEAHTFVTLDLDRLRDFDLVVDCTASTIFQLKLERDWSKFDGQTPTMLSMVIDGGAKHCLSVALRKGATAGIWNAYLCAKMHITTSGIASEHLNAFYSRIAAKVLFQPEPGCSEPTFVGSSADVASLAAEALNVTIERIVNGGNDAVFAWSAPGFGGRAIGPIELPDFCDVAVGSYRLRINQNVFIKARSWARKNRRDRSPEYETGGLLWGHWDAAVGCIWVFDASGPPPDSRHDPTHFLCGTEGTLEEHIYRQERSYGASGFVGHWHTHPEMSSNQSGTDLSSMATLVSAIGGNQKRSLMLIFGRTDGKTTVGAYIYESMDLFASGDVIEVGATQFEHHIEIA